MKGLRTVVYRVGDLDEAKEWYTKAVGHEPYFDQPFYVGYNVGGYELGLQPAEDDRRPGGGGVEAYWGVEDCRAELARLIELGGTLHQDIFDVGEGVLIAAVKDPFGNAFGVIENRFFKAE